MPLFRISNSTREAQNQSRCYNTIQEEIPDTHSKTRQLIMKTVHTDETWFCFQHKVNLNLHTSTVYVFRIKYFKKIFEIFLNFENMLVLCFQKNNLEIL